MPEPNNISVRAARAEELLAAARVYVRADDELDQRLHGRSLREPAASGVAAESAALADLRLFHGESPERVLVAARGEEVVGVAAAAIRERHWHLVSLFVLPEAQGRGIGRALLDRMHGVGTTAGCDVFTLHASDDPRALARYLSLGLAPGPTTIVLRADAARLPPPRWDDGLEAVPLRADDAATLATVGDVDRVVRGVRRPEDIRRWLAGGSVGALLLRRDGGAPAGWFLVSGGEAAGRIGPVAAMDAERVGQVVARALAAAGEAGSRSDRSWRIDVPGENRAAIPPLVAAGFRPERLSPLFASGPIGRFDRYVIHDEDLL